MKLMLTQLSTKLELKLKLSLAKVHNKLGQRQSQIILRRLLHQINHLQVSNHKTSLANFYPFTLDSTIHLSKGHCPGEICPYQQKLNSLILKNFQVSFLGQLSKGVPKKVIRKYTSSYEYILAQIGMELQVTHGTHVDSLSIKSLESLDSEYW